MPIGACAAWPTAAPRSGLLHNGFSALRPTNALKQSSPVLPLWPGVVKPKIHAMFKRLLGSSISAVLRQHTDSGNPVCPPLEGLRATRPRSSLREWITSSVSPMFGAATQGETGAMSGGEQQLDAARNDFIDTLADIRTQQAGDLLRRIRLARSLRELWFLRTEVFNLVAHHRDQAEANHRMGVLAAHFPRQVQASTARRLGAKRA